MPVDMVTIIATIAGLCLFETISSVDNAIINAQVLATMQPKARRWFLVWGLLLDSFAFHVPSWVSPAATFGVVGYFFVKSRIAIAATAESIE